MTSTSLDYFDRMYRRPDPWGYESTWYEQRKYALTLAALRRQHYDNGFEPGCSIGVLTALLAPRCRRLLAADFHDGALSRARQRVRSDDHVELARLEVPRQWPHGTFDLIVISELAYYLDLTSHARLVDRVHDSLAPGGDLVLVHWRGETNYPQTGDDVHRHWSDDGRFRTAVHHEEDEFLLDILEIPRTTASMTRSVDGIAVIVPVHDEQELLGACLASVQVALDHPHVRHLTSTVVVVLDDCTDGSRLVAEQHLRPQDVLVETSSRNVGAARALGCHLALTRLRDHGLTAASAWLGQTDADTRVPPWWVIGHLHYARTADAVAGVVRVDDWSQHPTGTEARFEQAYTPAGDAPSSGTSRVRHEHVHGANLGVRGDSYLRAGGFPSLHCSEDHTLWNAIERDGGAMVATRRVWVTTSARRAGRAPGGFADTLCRLGGAGDPS